jgi:YVTN family beta-propeller protein
LKHTASYWITLSALIAALVGIAVLPGSRRLAAAQVQDLRSLLPGQDRLVNGKIITQPPLGTVSRVGSFPANMVLHPGGKFAATCAMGFQGRLTSLSTSTGKPVSRVDFLVSTSNAYYGLYYGLAAGPLKHDGSCTLYASQALNSTIAILHWGGDGTLTKTGTISTDSSIITDQFAAGLALDASGRYLYVTNLNPSDTSALLTFWVPASVTVYDTHTLKSVSKYLFSNTPSMSATTTARDAPANPNFPMAIAVFADGSKVYVASERDGGTGAPDSVGAGLYVLNVDSSKQLTLKTTIATGAHPDALLLDEKDNRLFVANGGSDTVTVVDTTTDQVTQTVLLRPTGTVTLPGATPTGLALSHDRSTLYVTLGDLNAVAVISVPAADSPALQGYVPVGWYPTACLVAPDNEMLLVANGNGSTNRLPNPEFNPYHPVDVFADAVASPKFDLNVIRGTVQAIPLPIGPAQLGQFTQEVTNNNLVDLIAHPPPNPLAGIGVQAGEIRHLIYVVKENRSFDQLLGDWDSKVASVDKDLCLFPGSSSTPPDYRKHPAVTPNLHQLAANFVLLDNFYNNAPVSGEGWCWVTQGMANEFAMRMVPYINRLPTPPGLSGTAAFFALNYHFEGQNNGYPTGGFPPKDVDGLFLASAHSNGLQPIPNVAEAPGGYIWDLVKKAGLTYRNYGFYLSVAPAQTILIKSEPHFGIFFPDNFPAVAGLQPPGHLQSPPLQNSPGVTDYDFRELDLDYADSDAPSHYNSPPSTPTYGQYKSQSRFAEWNREFQAMLKNDPTGDSVPNFMMVRFPRDHSQGLTSKVHSPAAMVADNDYAVGQLVQAVSKSPIWSSTAILVIEDDSQFGADHVDCHRGPALVISPWIKKGAVDHSFYDTNSVLRTLELLMDLPPMTQYDAVANPIGFDAASRSTGVWDTAPNNNATYAAILPPKKVISEMNQPASWLAKNDPRRRLALASQRMNFHLADQAPALQLNDIIWKSVKGPSSPMPPPRFNDIASLRGTAAGKRPAPRDPDD